MTNPASLPWKDDIRQKLVKEFENNVEGLTRALFYLDEEDRQYPDGNAPAWKTLKSTLYSDKVFKKYAKKLIDDTKTAEKDEAFRRIMNLLYTQLMDANVEELPEGHGQSFELVIFGRSGIPATTGFASLARAWEMMPASSQAQLLECLPMIIRNRQIVSSVDRVTSVVSKAGAKVVVVTLVAVQLSWEAVKNIYRWWKGEISGKRCVKNILDATFSIGAGLAGGAAAATLGGALAGPIGSVVGGMVGGFLSAAAMEALSDRMTQWLFDIPKEESLENAYNFLGVKPSASNHDINTSYRQLCLKYHPDKGGSQEDFHFLQMNMAVIKAARGELYS